MKTHLNPLNDLGYKPDDLSVQITELLVATSDTSAHPACAPLLKEVPFPIGTHISTPIVLENGDICGTLCCFSFHPVDQPNVDDLKKLEFTAKLAAQKLNQRRVVRQAPASVPQWQLKPK